MKISEKERKLIAAKKIKAVIRWENIEEKTGDALFDVNGVVYTLVEKKYWALHRIAGKRSRIDFGCVDVSSFRKLVGDLYGNYDVRVKDIVYDIIFKPHKRQMTLGGV